MSVTCPRVGIGVIIENSEGKILVGKRKGDHAPFWSIPGGKLDLGETFEEAAIREVKEETNLKIKDPKVISVTNNLKTYREEGVHFISVNVLARNFEGNLVSMEPEKCDQWKWVDPKEIPSPHFEASKMSIKFYLEGDFYQNLF